MVFQVLTYSSKRYPDPQENRRSCAKDAIMSNFGKYRGKVIDPVDPLQLGRIVALVPAISEFPLNWAMPATPYAGAGVGFFAIPPVGANVWIEFEGGDPDYPIWAGCFWGQGEAPAEPALPTTIMLKTEQGTLSINDLDAELKLSLTAADDVMSLAMSPAGIKLSLNQVTISITRDAISLSHAPSSVDVTPAAIGLSSAWANVEIAPAAIAIENGAGSIAVSPVGVTINEGALEII
jgi:hypothetical protein